jgi:hypothetical protein
MLRTNPAHESLEEDMRQCIHISESNDNPDYEAEYLLADMCARGMLIMYYDDNNVITEVIPLTISTYKYLRHAFDFTSVCADFYYFTGIYNYYSEAYPRIYPVYKSLARLFPPGNMETGLKELKKAASNSVVLSAESYSLLSLIYLGFENKYQESLDYSRILHEKYPENGFYRATCIRNLLLLKRYDEAEKLLMAPTGGAVNKFVDAQFLILKGILHEKKYLDNEQAQKYYNDGIHEITKFGEYGDEYAAYGYFGLSRISEAGSEKHNNKAYRREAMKLASFKKIDFDK